MCSRRDYKNLLKKSHLSESAKEDTASGQDETGFSSLRHSSAGMQHRARVP